MKNSKLVVDIETDAIPSTKVWMVGCLDVDTQEENTFLYPVDTKELTACLNSYETIIGHNIIGFDLPVLERVLGVTVSPSVKIVDTLILSRLYNPQLENGHSLKAWGERLKFPKGDHNDWTKLTPEMIEYCKQDLRVTAKVYEVLMGRLAEFEGESIDLEHRVQHIITSQINNGWLLDTKQCWNLLADLKVRKMELEHEVHARFQPLPVFIKEVTPKINKDGTLSTVGLKFISDDKSYLNDLVGGRFSRVDFPEFNLGSRQQIGRYLQFFGWKPKDFTEKGHAIVDESVLKNVTHIPEAQMIAEYLLITKRMAQVDSWLKAQKEDTQRVHGTVNTIGAVTGRMTHSGPNMAQVPAAKTDKEGNLIWGAEGGYGTDCRACWTIPKGYKLVGCDASGLELRMLCHYMDDKEYTNEVINGDVHTANQIAAGLPTRNDAKTFIYAFLYGAGDSKIGSIVGGGRKHGADLKQQFLDNVPSLGGLRERVERAVEARGYLKGIDGRKLIIRSPHAALNTLLQSAGAIVMKKALVIFDDFYPKWGLDIKYVGNIHDEVQMEVKEEHAEKAGWLFVECIKTAGVQLGMKCPLDAEFKVGDTWAETH